MACKVKRVIHDFSVRNAKHETLCEGFKEVGFSVPACGYIIEGWHEWLARCSVSCTTSQYGMQSMDLCVKGSSCRV